MNNFSINSIIFSYFWIFEILFLICVKKFTIIIRIKNIQPSFGLVPKCQMPKYPHSEVTWALPSAFYHSIQAQQLRCNKSGLLLFRLVHIVSEVVLCLLISIQNVFSMWTLNFTCALYEWNVFVVIKISLPSPKKCAWVSLFQTEKTHAQLLA
jgi:hypothetical protein